MRSISPLLYTKLMKQRDCGFVSSSVWPVSKLHSHFPTLAVFIQIDVRAIGLESFRLFGATVFGATAASFQTSGTRCASEDLLKMLWKTGLVSC